MTHTTTRRRWTPVTEETLVQDMFELTRFFLGPMRHRWPAGWEDWRARRVAEDAIVLRAMNGRAS